MSQIVHSQRAVLCRVGLEFEVVDLQTARLELVAYKQSSVVSTKSQQGRESEIFYSSDGVTQYILKFHWLKPTLNCLDVKPI